MQTQTTETLVVTRTLKATPSKVFSAWLDPALVAKWFMPNTRWVKCEPDIEAAVGGSYNLAWTHSDGDQFNVGGKIVEIVPDELISFTWKDANNPESLVTITLKPAGEGTELTLSHSKLASSDMKNNVSQGWAGCLDMLTSFIEA